MIDDIKQNIGAKVKLVRSDANLTQEQLAFDIEVSVETISNIERGKVIPSIDTLLKISQKLNFSISDFFAGLDRKKLSNKRIESEARMLHNIKKLENKELDFAIKQVELLIEYLNSK